MAARSLKEIYDSMTGKVAALNELQNLQPKIENAEKLLDDLSTNSKVGIWRLFYWVIAVAIWTHEKLWDLFKKELEEIIVTAIPGTMRWYQEQCYKFQLGDSLEYIDEIYQYQTYDPSKRIIKFVTVLEENRELILKVAKMNEQGRPEALTASECDAFKGYIRLIKHAGTDIAVISEKPNLMTIDVKIYYDASVIDQNGFKLSDPEMEPVKEAINDYLANLPFNGLFNMSQLSAAISQAEGVIYCDIISVMAESYVAGELKLKEVDVNYTAPSGYIEMGYDSTPSNIEYLQP